jgi:FAD/FMN-containing dehydrogenase
MSPTPELQQLTDRAEIADLVARLCVCLDESGFDDMAGLLAGEATVRTIRGEVVGRDAVVEQARRTHPADQRFQHVITNLLVDLDGDRATARANLEVHITVPGDGPAGDGSPAPAPRASLGNVYRFGLARSEAGWRFARVEIEPVWVSGTLPPTVLPAAV